MQPKSDVPNLDILRGLAVLLVVVDHSGKFLGLPPGPLNPLGGTGVYLFFVHTCLVLMLSLERQQARQTGGLSMTFYTRRFFRIYPLSVFFVLLVAGFSIPAHYIAGPFRVALLSPSWRELFSNLALSMNLTADRPILGQLWSLPIEVQMYVFLPPLYLLARRYGPVLVSALWVFAALIALLHGWLDFRGSARLSLIRYVPCFVPGVIAYTLWRSRPRFRAIFWLPTLFVLCGFYYAIRTPAASWLMCLAVGLAAPFFQQATARWLVIPAHYVAKYSYGIYLGHVLALWIGFNLVRGPFVIQTVLWLVALVVIPVAAFHWLESPCITLGVRVSLYWDARAIRKEVPALASVGGESALSRARTASR